MLRCIVCHEIGHICCAKINNKITIFNENPYNINKVIIDISDDESTSNTITHNNIEND